MKLSSGYYWPDRIREKDIEYAVKKLHQSERILDYCEKDLIIQAGGCVGLYPKIYSKAFKQVITFEPDPENFKCLGANLKGRDNVKKVLGALGDSCKDGFYQKYGYSTGYIAVEGLPIKIYSIDSLNLTRCSAIQLDIEGYELPALVGAYRTIEKFKPIIQLEVNKNVKKEPEKDPNYNFLRLFGYTFIKRVGKDHIYGVPHAETQDNIG